MLPSHQCSAAAFIDEEKCLSERRQTSRQDYGSSLHLRLPRKVAICASSMSRIPTNRSLHLLDTPALQLSYVFLHLTCVTQNHDRFLDFPHVRPCIRGEKKRLPLFGSTRRTAIWGSISQDATHRSNRLRHVPVCVCEQT